MLHRHLEDTHPFSSAAIDDIIDRGGLMDWIALRDKADGDPVVANRVRKVCEAHCADPYAQRYHLWRFYVRQTPA